MKGQYTKKKLLVLFSIFYLLLSSFAILPIQASQNQSSELIFNFMNFQLINSTNNGSKNAFIYSYNITSPNNATFSWKIDISRNDGLYTYKFDSLNGTESLIVNVSKSNLIQYNFSLSGDYLIQVYWFSSTKDILLYKEYNVPAICSLQTNLQSNNFSYNYWWHWQLSEPNQFNVREFNFEFDVYFKEQYNLSLDYVLTINKISNTRNQKIVNTVSGSKLMSGKGNTMEELSLSSPIAGSGNYQAVFQWKDLLVYDLGNINRTININFESPVLNINHGAPDSPQANYYYRDTNSFGSSFFISFFIIGSVFLFVMYVVFKNQKNFNQSFTHRNNFNSYAGNKNLNMRKPLVVSFCSNCGSRIIPNDPYCPDCGTKLD